MRVISTSSWEDVSALEGIRTPNLLIRSQMLYPLSYERGCVASLRHSAGGMRYVGCGPSFHRYVQPLPSGGQRVTVQAEGHRVDSPASPGGKRRGQDGTAGEPAGGPDPPGINWPPFVVHAHP